MPKHALFTEGSTGGKHRLVIEPGPGGQHKFFEDAPVNLLSPQQWSLEDGTTAGWVGIHSSPVLNILTAPDADPTGGGHSLLLGSSTGIGSPGIRTAGTGTAGIPVSPGQGYVACFRARGIYPLGVLTEYYWYASDGSLIGGGPTVGNPTSAYGRGGVVHDGTWGSYYEDTGAVTAPTGAAFMALGLALTNINVANDYQCIFDQIGLYALSAPALLFIAP